MLRRLLAVLILHFLLCVGCFAAGVSAEALTLPGVEVTAQSAPHDPAAPSGLSDADDHALMDDKDDFPDQLEPHLLTDAGAIHSMAVVAPLVISALSVVVAPPHKPPKTSGFFA